MRADSLFRMFSLSPGSVGTLSLLFVFIVLVAGCNSTSDSEDPVIIGVPPEDAFLGVEYFYNFGAVDKDDVLNFSLTNAPSWLALEDTNNKARQGIIMRGVPGITGGERGRSDLGRTSRINLVGNDGDTLGAQSFSVNVQENVLSVVSQDYPEAKPEPDQEEDKNNDEEEEIPDFQCAQPFTDGEGEHSYPINLYDESGSVNGTETKTTKTRPVLVQVNLDQPSVTRIKVAFELRSNFDPNRCDNGFTAPHQRCDTGLANSDEAIVGRDVIALGSGTGDSLPVPDYIEYQQDEEGRYTKGLLTLEPGITDCFVRIEIIDDLEPERLEAFTFALTEVRSGIAGLGPSNTEVREPLRIEDNEPTVIIQTRRGGQRDVVNLGTVTEYTAVIEGDRDDVFFARIGALAESDAIQGTDFTLEFDPIDENEQPPTLMDTDLIRFPIGTDEVTFRLRTPDTAAFSNPAENDRFAILGLNAGFQAGRSNFTAARSENSLRVSINELNNLPEVGADTGFVPTDMAIGQNGRTFIVGYDAASNNEPLVRVINQKGDQVSEVKLFPRGISLEALPVIATSVRDIESGREEVLRFEFAVSFAVEEDEDENPTPGDLNIVTQRWFFDTALSPEGYAQDWQLVNGSDQDDIPRWISIEPTTGDVYVAGVTRGLFEEDDQANGLFGSFVQLINSQEDGAELVPELAWVRKAESVSHDERVVGGGLLNTQPIVIGDSSGSVEGESQLGGIDAFFFRAQRPEDQVDVQQIGTEADENMVDGFFALSNVWLVGNSNGEYRVEVQRGVRELIREPADSSAGFIFGYTPSGSPIEAFRFNDADDVSDETLRVAMIFDDDLVAAGFTNGILTEDPAVQTNTLSDPAIFRRDRLPRFEDMDDEEEVIIEPSQQWDRQIAVPDPETGRVEALANYRNDEISALVRRDSTTGSIWTLHLLSPEGDPINFE